MKSTEITPDAHNRFMEQRGLRPMIQRCRFCDWTAEGTFGETKLLADAHRRTVHPEAKQRTRFTRSRAGIRTIGAKTLEENVANVRLQGGWASVEGAMDA